MLNVPESVKALFKTDGVNKNFCVHFPNGEFPDINNGQIVRESLHFSESVCSQSTFKFGLAEASTLEFECVGIGNIYGMTIDASIGISLNSLSAADILAIEADPGDGSVSIGKNLLPTLGAATTVNGVTWTPMADGTISVNGTATSLSRIYLGIEGITLPAGTYTTNSITLNGCTVIVYEVRDGSLTQIKYGGGTFTLSAEKNVCVEFSILSGQTVQNLLVMPQLEVGQERTSYEPYQKRYIVPLGTFRVESCPRNRGAMARRKVTAYGANLGSDSWLAPPEAEKQRGKYRVASYALGSISSLIAANAGWWSPKYIENNFTKSSISLTFAETSLAAPSDISWRVPKGSGYYEYNLHASNVKYSTYSGTIPTQAGVDTFVSIDSGGAFQAVNLATIEREFYQFPITPRPIRQIVANAFSGVSLESVVSSYHYLGGDVPIYLQSIGATTQISLLAGLAISLTLTAHDTTTGTTQTYTATADQSAYSTAPNAYTLTMDDPIDIPVVIDSIGTAEVVNGVTWYSFAGSYTMQSILGGSIELAAMFALADRTGNAKIFALDNSSPIEILPADYEDVWWDEYDVSPIGSVIASYKDIDTAEMMTTTIEIGDGESIYDLTENEYIKKIYPMTLAELTSYLTSEFRANSAKAAFTPIELEMRGLPWIEAGDALEITTDDGSLVKSYALRIELDGIQYLTATITAKGGEIIGEAEETESDEE
jgi:hypothetical protein